MAKRSNLSKRRSYKRRSNLSKRRSYKRRSSLSKRRSYKRRRTQKRRNNMKRLRVKGGATDGDTTEDDRVKALLSTYSDVPFNYDELPPEDKKQVAAIVKLQVPDYIDDLYDQLGEPLNIFENKRNVYKVLVTDRVKIEILENELTGRSLLQSSDRGKGIFGDRLFG